MLDQRTATAFRDHVALRRAAPAVDEEHFRLVTGFNDIFVSIAAILLLVALGWIGGRAGAAVAGLAVAAASWALAEYFTRRRRMALPSILLLITFIYGVASGLLGLFGQSLLDADRSGDTGAALTAALVAAVTTGAAWAHWRRFHVPITIAAGAGAAVALLLSLAIALLAAARDLILPLVLLCGLSVFAFAMRWDMSDRVRQTRRSDVAFWLHLMAAPMIAHPIFWMLGLLGGESGVGKAALVILLYICFGFVALAVDRRALLVSSLFYVLYAMSRLFEQFGAVSLSLALTGLLIGSALLMLSAFWHVARRKVVQLLPAHMQARLPPVSAAATT